MVAQDEDEEDQQSDTFMTKNQILLLQQQLRQHVQLTTQHFLQTCQHPMYGNYAKDFKTILVNYGTSSMNDRQNDKLKWKCKNYTHKLLLYYYT